MKKSQRFSNMHPDDMEEFGMDWNRDLSWEDFAYHTYKTGRSESKARRNRRRAKRDEHMDDSVED